MAKRGDWDYALHIKGVTVESLGMARIAEYLRDFAILLGDQSSPKFAGVVKGSAVLRASVEDEQKEFVLRHMHDAASNDDSSGHVSYLRIERMMRENGARGAVIDRKKNIIVRFDTSNSANDDADELIVSDEAALDGVVVGIAGTDETVHVRLQISTKLIYNISVRNMMLARELANKFRGESIRLHVHGKWKRNSKGVWEPHTLHADRVEELDQRPAADIIRDLVSIKGNGWADIGEGDAYWQNLRGIDDRSN